MQKATLFMKLSIAFIGIIVLLFSVILFPEFYNKTTEIAKIASLRLSHLFLSDNILFLGGIYLTSIPFLFLGGVYLSLFPFFLALYQSIKLLGLINERKAFSDLSVFILKKIKYCAIVIFILYIFGTMPFWHCFAEIEDSPGIILIGLIISIAPLVVATFAAILEKLLQEAINIKEEKDLIV